jgi:protein-S-isoprenylcysteine O-methyltransferase Ste14
VIEIPWIVLGLVWLAGSMRGKRTTRRETIPERAFHLIGSALASLLLFTGREQSASSIREASGLVLCCAGIAFAIWARVILGTNWSGTITLKEDHELIRRGPYRFVRHPIYSGLLLGILGTAIYLGRWQGFAGFVIAFVTWWEKSRIEERFMLDHFGDQYRRFQREVSALIPGLL